MQFDESELFETDYKSRRICSYHGCQALIADAVSKDVIWCTNHQIKFAMFHRHKVNEKLVPEDVSKFIYCHVNGANVREAAKAIGYNERTLSRMVQSGKVEAHWDLHKGHSYLIPQPELIRIAKLYFCWMPTAKFANTLGICRQVFRKHALKGEFGPTNTDLYGNTCLRAEIWDKLPLLKRAYDRNGRKNKSRRQYKERLSKTEFTPEMIAKMLDDVSKTTVIKWCKNNSLKYHQIGNAFVISKKDLIDFCQRVADGQTELWKHSRVEIGKLLEKLKSS